MFTALIMFCTPDQTTCTVIASPNIQPSLEMCMMEMNEAVLRLQQQFLVTDKHCFSWAIKA